jgi:hypothetical protein
MHDCAFPTHFANQIEFELLEIAQAAVDQLGGAAAGAFRKVGFFDQQCANPPGRRIEGNARSGYTTTDYN